MDRNNDRVLPFDVREFADRLMTLSLAQAAELRVYLEEVHDIRPAVSAVTVKEKTVTPTPSPEPTHFSVLLQGLADAEKKIGVFKAVREITNLGLKETRELVEGAPAVVRANLLRDEAEALRKKLENAGARVALAPTAEG